MRFNMFSSGLAVATMMAAFVPSSFTSVGAVHIDSNLSSSNEQFEAAL